MVPDYLTPPNSCAVHWKLGLPKNCFVAAVDGTCNSFLLQLALAEQMILGGQARYGLSLIHI